MRSLYFHQYFISSTLSALMDVIFPVNINNKRNSHRCLSSCYSYNKQCKKVSLHLIRVKIPVENHKIDIH